VNWSLLHGFPRLKQKNPHQVFLLDFVLNQVILASLFAYVDFHENGNYVVVFF
jgi:hypothetical protein